MSTDDFVGPSGRVRYLSYALTMAFYIPGATPNGRVERALLGALGSELDEQRSHFQQAN